jgi:hypothetical protein
VTESTYIALHPFRFGTEELQAGDPVPVEPGRDYPLMVRTGMVRVVHPPVSAALGGPQDLALTLTPGTRAYFVGEDGAHTLVTFLGSEPASDEARALLDLEPGESVASVLFPDDPDTATGVRTAALLPEEPTARLLADLTAQITDAAAQPTPAQERTIAGQEERIAFLELLVQAIRTPGEALPADFPGAKEAQANGLLTLAGLALLAAGERGRAHLIALDGIGAKTADKMLAALAAAPDPLANTSPAPDSATPPAEV